MSLGRFVQVYSNLPINVRKEIVVVVDVDGKPKPISWDVAYIEIKNKTALGDVILKKLIELQII